MTTVNISAVDVFCGAGGLTHGLQKAGINVQLGVDIDPACEYPFSKNNKASFLKKSVNDLSSADITEYFEDGYTLLAGCAPCQTFSTYNQKACSSDDRWSLLLQFSRLVKETKPDIVTMENVPGLKDQNVFADFVSELKENGYKIWFGVIDSSKYGLPQNRKRLVLLASMLGEIKMLSPEQLKSKTKTVHQAISKLPKLCAGEIDPKDPLHQSASLSELNLKRIKASKPNGTWRDWNKDLVADCHKKESGKTYPSVYARMSWDQPAPTMTTQFYGFGNGRFGHPEQDRAISLREGAIFQGFPKRYKFIQPNTVISKRSIAKLIGNAVPVKLGEVIGKSIIYHLQKINQS